MASVFAGFLLALGLYPKYSQIGAFTYRFETKSSSIHNLWTNWLYYIIHYIFILFRKMHCPTGGTFHIIFKTILVKPLSNIDNLYHLKAFSIFDRFSK